MDRFERLVVEQIPSLRRYARTLLGSASEADDLVQDCLARALGRRRLWQRHRDIRPWLFTIMHHLYVNQLSREATRANHEPPSLHAPSASPDALLTLRDLEAALATLPAEQREVLALVAVEGLSYEEASLVADVPIGTVMSRLSRGRARLREVLAKAAGNRRGRKSS